MNADDAVLRVVLSVDVEEEGLFGGRYPRFATVRNVAWLWRLVPLLQRTDMPVTLLCTYPVFNDTAACRAMDKLRAQCRVEVGAHLHHWNTPPLDFDTTESYHASASVPLEIMQRKLHHLLKYGKVYAGQDLTSFRMGRWDLRRCHWPLLVRMGIKVDSSVRPLHCGGNAYDGHGCGGQCLGCGGAGAVPDHFAAPAHPYRVRVAVDGGEKEIFEAPLTCVPLVPLLMPVLRWAPRRVRSTVHSWGALSTLPAYHPLWALRRITVEQLKQGQRVLALTWHSSEMMPGGTPHITEEQQARDLVKKIESYLLWLREYWTRRGPAGAEVRGVTLDQLRQECSDAPLYGMREDSENNNAIQNSQSSGQGSATPLSYPSGTSLQGSACTAQSVGDWLWTGHMHGR